MLGDLAVGRGRQAFDRLALVLGQLLGTATSTVTRRSPALRGLATPLPLTRSVRPERVPDGMRIGDRAALQGRHQDVGPERGLGERDRHGQREVVALPAEQAVGVTRW